MDKTFYTKLIYECKDPDDFGPRRVEVSETVWDGNLEQLLKMFHTIAIGATFQEVSFKRVLAGYLEENYQADVIFPEDKED